MTMDEDSVNGWRTTLRDKGDKAAYGMNKYLPAAIVEAVLTAAISERT